MLVSNSAAGAQEEGIALTEPFRQALYKCFACMRLDVEQAPKRLTSMFSLLKKFRPLMIHTFIQSMNEAFERLSRVSLDPSVALRARASELTKKADEMMLKVGEMRRNTVGSSPARADELSRLSGELREEAHKHMDGMPTDAFDAAYFTRWVKHFRFEQYSPHALIFNEDTGMAKLSMLYELSSVSPHAN